MLECFQIEPSDQTNYGLINKIKMWKYFNLYF